MAEERSRHPEGGIPDVTDDVDLRLEDIQHDLDRLRSVRPEQWKQGGLYATLEQMDKQIDMDASLLRFLEAYTRRVDLMMEQLRELRARIEDSNR